MVRKELMNLRERDTELVAELVEGLACGNDYAIEIERDPLDHRAAA